MKMKCVSTIASLILLFILVNVSLWYVSFFIFEDSAIVTQQNENGHQSIDIVAASKNHGPNGILGDIDSGMLTSLSSPSLEMRENVDFLLTPALLVQECISEDTIITYPEE